MSRYVTYSDWLYNGELFIDPPKDAVGFVYLITRTNIDENPVEPMFYIGKKSFKTNKGISSDWMSYYGSSDLLKTSIIKNGIHNFTREILHITYSKSETTYKEVMEQVNRHVLKVDRTSVMPKKYYNKNILGKIYSDSVFTKKDLTRIKDYLTGPDTDYTRVAVTDGVKTKYVYTDIEEITNWLQNNPGWVIGSTIHNNTGGSVAVTDGVKTKYIDESDIDKYLSMGYQLGSSIPVARRNMKCVTNGEVDMYVPEEDAELYLISNPNYYLGSKVKGEFIQVYHKTTRQGKRIRKDYLDEFLKENPMWVKEYPTADKVVQFVSMINENTETQCSVPTTCIEEFTAQGFRLAKNKETLSMIKKWVTKEGENVKVFKSELDQYLKDGWSLGRDLSYIDRSIKPRPKRPMSERGVVRVSCEVTKESREIPESTLEQYLLDNPTWFKGHLKRGFGTTNNVVFAKNIEDGALVTVSVEEFNSNKHKYVSRNTRQVVISVGDSIVYKGYLVPWLIANGLPEYPFKTAIRSTGVVARAGKYKDIITEDYIIKEFSD